MHGSRDVTDRLNGLRHEARTVAGILGVPVLPIVSMEGPAIPCNGLVLDGLRIVAADRLVPALRALGDRQAPGPHPGQRAAQLLKPYGRR